MTVPEAVMNELDGAWSVTFSDEAGNQGRKIDLMGGSGFFWADRMASVFIAEAFGLDVVNWSPQPDGSYRANLKPLPEGQAPSSEERYQEEVGNGPDRTGCAG